MTSVLRDYQQKALDDIRALYRKGTKKALLHLATGGGKTLIFSQILKSASEKGKNAIMVVRGKSLVHQAADRLTREGVEFGIFQANHWNKNRQAKIQLCSIDTLFRRQIAPPAELVVIDEAHFAISDSFLWLAQQYPNAFFLGVTATPYPKKPLRHIANEVVFPIGIRGLIDQGYLVGARYFAPSEPNLENVGIDSKTKDYNLSQLADACATKVLIGDVVKNYLRICPDQPAICFAVSKAHSNKICDQFIEHGISAIHIEDSTTDNQRAEVLKKHEAGEIKVICNVGILCTGVDMPWLKAVIMARPTKSKILYIQQAGRGTRIYNGKEFFFLIDHAGNISEHGFITEDHPAELDGKEQKKKFEAELSTCPQCFCIYEGNGNCPECGEIREKKKIEKQHIEADLVEIDPSLITENLITEKKLHNFPTNTVHMIIDPSNPKLNNDINRWITLALNKGHKPGTVWYKLKANYGDDIAKILWNRIKIKINEISEKPSP